MDNASDQPSAAEIRFSATSQHEALIDALHEQAQLLKSLSQEIVALRTSLIQPQATSPNRIAIRPLPQAPSYRHIWEEEILKCSVNGDDDGLLKSFTWRRGLTVEGLLEPHRPWNSWSYRAAYPKLSSFLEKASLAEASKSQVVSEDFNDKGKVSRWESADGILDTGSLWTALRTCTETLKGADYTNSTPLKVAALSRIVRIVDVSPFVVAILLGSTARINLWSIPPFIERYLNFSNWGSASLYAIKTNKHRGANSFVFEYHFAFYFVPQSPMDPDLATKDFRGLRRSSAFGNISGDKSKWIYEEQMSCILIGQGHDVYTNYQLAERYFTGPYVTGTGRASLFVNPDRAGWTPPAIFLSWIMLALHHVRWRWQSAIDSVDTQIDAPSDVIFSEDNPDLLSDDPQFSRSRTYFWALQAYKMFDETLSATIDTWFNFRRDTLPKLDDGRMPAEDWDTYTRGIDLAIEKLEDKLAHVRKKVEEVQNLRAGLFGASALFDSRTTVRQGENIALLTYITLLFLPLSFCTSIFGMQVVLPNLPFKVFIITMPSIFAFTAVLTLNLQNIIGTINLATQAVTSWMRTLMKSYQHRKWNETAKALHVERNPHQLPRRKLNARHSHWVYFFFAIEGILVHLPIHEIDWAYSSIRNLFRIKEQSGPSEEFAGLEVGEASDISRAARVKAAMEAKKERKAKRKWTKAAAALSHAMLAGFRAIALTLWLILIAIDFLILTFYAMLASPQAEESDPRSKLFDKSVILILRPWHWLRQSASSTSGDNAARPSTAKRELPIPNKDEHQSGGPLERNLGEKISNRKRRVSIPFLVPENRPSRERKRWRKVKHSQVGIPSRDMAAVPAFRTGEGFFNGPFAETSPPPERSREVMGSNAVDLTIGAEYQTLYATTQYTGGVHSSAIFAAQDRKHTAKPGGMKIDL